MSKDSALAMVSGNPVLSSNGVATGPLGEGSIPLPPSGESQAELKSTPFQQFAKKEAEIQRRREEFKKEREEFEKERTRVNGMAKTYDEFLAKRKENPMDAMKMLGFSETEVFNYLAASEKPQLTPEEQMIQTAEKAADAKLKAYEEAQLKKEQEVQAKADQETIQDYKRQIGSLIAASPELYEYCHYYGPEAESLVYTLTKQSIMDSKGQDVLSTQEAVQMAEEYFETRDKEMNTLKKRKSWGANQVDAIDAPLKAEVSPQVDRSPLSEKKPLNRTLTNSDRATVASTQVRQKETPAQKRERLMNALRNGKM